jgi:predicted KAP-like P-loop ATPase
MILAMEDCIEQKNFKTIKLNPIDEGLEKHGFISTICREKVQAGQKKVLEVPYCTQAIQCLLNLT